MVGWCSVDSYGANCLDEVLPLKSPLVGQLLDATTQNALEGVRVRVVSPDGVDVTDDPASEQTDSRGVSR